VVLCRVVFLLVVCVVSLSNHTTLLFTGSCHHRCLLPLSKLKAQATLSVLIADGGCNVMIKVSRMPCVLFVGSSLLLPFSLTPLLTIFLFFQSRLIQRSYLLVPNFALLVSLLLLVIVVVVCWWDCLTGRRVLWN
jgi:hypothetical protein